MKIFFPITILICTTLISVAQSPKTNMVGELVSTENYFSSLVKEKGMPYAFKKVSDENTLIFKPQPVNALDYYAKMRESLGQFSCYPVYARISKSGDWGFTTGPFTFKHNSATTDEFGEYVSVWRKNKKGVWKLALDIGVTHPKPKTEVSLNFPEPTSTKYRKMIGNARLQQREDIVMTTDKLFSLQLQKTPYVGYKEFLYEDAKLLLPETLPLIGKKNIIEYLRKNAIQIETHVTHVDRALSGDLAYTYGTAIISKGLHSKPYHYVRIWEVGDSFKWSVLLEIFTPAEEVTDLKTD